LALSFDRDRLGAWASKRIEHFDLSEQLYTAIGLERDGEIIAVTVYNFYNGSNVAMSFAAVAGRRWLTREYLHAIFRYPFVQLGVRRVTGFVPAKNSDSLRFAHHLGAKLEGVMRHALPDDDLVILGILREDCKYGKE
jgi:RimJ/RimL family protein N-acetyltransferase